MTDEKPTKQNRSIRFDLADLVNAAALSIDVNRVCRQALKQAIKSAMRGRADDTLKKL